ncbi:MAG TPA: hypothetical protein PLI86_10870 [bacterium]|nr:hypothetical protein [bacterium]
MPGPISSLTTLKKTIAARRWFGDARLVYHGLGPVGADMFRHFIPVSAIVGLYDGDEVARHIEAEWGTRVFSYERMHGVRTLDNADFYSNFLREHGGEIAAYVDSLGGRPCLAPFAPSAPIHEFLFRLAPHWRLCSHTKVMQDFFEFKARLAQEAGRIGIPMPPESIVLPFSTLDYRRLADRFEGGFVIQTPLSQAGRGTEFVFDEEDFARVVEEKRRLMGHAFAVTSAKITPFLAGPSPNCTGCVVNGTVAVSQPDIQVCGDPHFVKLPGQYIGSDYTVDAFSPEQVRLMHDVVRRIGTWMGEHGYRGNFGVDFLSTVDRDHRVKDICVSEVNARMVGESQYLADFQAREDSVPLTFFHLAEWFEIREVSKAEIEEYNRTLPRIRGSALTLYSRGKGTFTPKGGVTSGVHRIEDGRLRRVRDGYLLSQTRSDDEFVLSVGVPREGLVVGHPERGDECISLCYILTRDSIVDPRNYRLVSAKWRGIADLVTESLGLAPCPPRRLPGDKGA